MSRISSFVHFSIVLFLYTGKVCALYSLSVYVCGGGEGMGTLYFRLDGGGGEGREGGGMVMYAGNR